MIELDISFYLGFFPFIAGGVVLHGSDIDDSDNLFWWPLNQASVKFIVVEPFEESVGWTVVG